MPKIEVTNCYIKPKLGDHENPFLQDPVVLDGYAIVPRDEVVEPHPPTPDRSGYAWAIKGAEHCEGPFETREKAIESATRDYGDMPGTIICIGSVSYADPVHYVPTDLDDMLERMDECAVDNEFGFWENEVFEPKPGAKEALEQTLKAWASHFVTSQVWTVSFDQEITL